MPENTRAALKISKTYFLVTIDSPIGIPAGLDKNGYIISALFALAQL